MVAAAVLGGARRAGESRRRAKKVVGPAMKDGKRLNGHVGVWVNHEVGAYMDDMRKERGAGGQIVYLFWKEKKRVNTNM